MNPHDALRTSRRGFLLGTGAVAAAAFLAACGEDPPKPAGAKGNTASGPWTFDDGSGKKLDLPQTPKRIVAYVGAAAPLWDVGIKPVGVFGPQKRSDGSKDPQAGNIDLTAITSVGNSWDDFSLEKFLALKPDLVVTGKYGAKPDELWAIPAEQLAKVRQAAPIVGINEFKQPLPSVIENYRALARSLGADLDSSDNKNAAKSFADASKSLGDAIKAKPGLKVMVAYADKDNLYIAKPDFFGDLMYYRSLGMDIVTGGGSDDYWEMLSWEQASKYPADLIITDSRSHALTHKQMAAFPTWAQLPAVKAGQIGLWPGESRYSNQLSAKIIDDLTTQVTRAKTTVVA